MQTYTSSAVSGKRIYSKDAGAIKAGDKWIIKGNSGPNPGRGAFHVAEFDGPPSPRTALLCDSNGVPFKMVDGSEQKPIHSNTCSIYFFVPTPGIDPRTQDIGKSTGADYSHEDPLVPQNTMMQIEVVSDVGSQDGPLPQFCDFTAPRAAR
jgi:hypothetical protein